MLSITIMPAQNGWIIKVGCSTFVSTDRANMLHEIARYIDDPDSVEKEYREVAVNKMCDAPATPGPEASAEIETPRPQEQSGGGEQIRPESR